MSIRKKLVLSYIAMVAVPVLMFALSAILLFSLVFRGEDSRDGWQEGRGNPFLGQDELSSGLRFLAEHDAERLRDSSFLARLDADSDERESGFVVERAGQPVYSSPWLREEADLNNLRALPVESEGDRWHPPFRIGDRGYSVERTAFAFADGSEGLLVTLTPSGSIPAQARFVPLLLLLLLVAVGVTNGGLTWLVSRSILNPLRALRQAAQLIKEGHLDTPLAGLGKNELGDVGRTFEEMRLRLKDSIAAQLHYEENRKALLAHISHDLKTPITAIGHCVQGLQDGIADSPEKREKYYAMLARKTADLDRLIDELFLFSKLDMRSMPFQLEPVELTAFVRDFAEELGQDPSLPAMEIGLSVDSEAPLYVLADRDKLRRVFLNIVDNSVKYMVREPRRLDIRVSGSADRAIVSIRDNGVGMERTGLPQIFESFYREDPSRRTDTGSGLGLAIVEQIVAGHGGRVTADSAPGEGMCITIELNRRKGAGPDDGQNDAHH